MARGPAAGAIGPDGGLARRLICPASMKRSLVFAVAVLVASLFVGTALQVHAATTAAPTAPAAVQADDGATVGYWAAVSEAASH